MMLNAGNLQAWFSLKSIYFAKPNIDNFGWACLENVINKFWTRIENTHKRNTRNENEWNEAIYTEHQTKQAKKEKKMPTKGYECHLRMLTSAKCHTCKNLRALHFMWFASWRKEFSFSQAEQLCFC